MRISHILAFAAAATLSGVALADSSGATAPASQSAATVLVNASSPAAYKLTPADVEGMAGTFKLEDGRLLVLTSKRSTLYADFDGKREELVPVGANRFLSRDTGAQLTFDRVPFAVQVVLNQAKQ